VNVLGNGVLRQGTSTIEHMFEPRPDPPAGGEPTATPGPTLEGPAAQVHLPAPPGPAEPEFVLAAFPQLQAASGPALAGLLAELKPRDLGDFDPVELIAAAERVSSWAAAVQVAAVGELDRRTHG